VIDKALLWKAWPDGFLDARGVRTVGGWERNALGWMAPEDRVHQHVAQVYTTGDLVEALKAGDLFPHMDPTDPATWACALRDLADACAGTDTRTGMGKHGCVSFAWVQDLTGSWRLYGYNLHERVSFLDWTVHSGAMLYFHTGVYDTSHPGPAKADRIIGEDADPVLALVLARAQVREETGR
jgi:hypothetical protein